MLLMPITGIFASAIVLGERPNLRSLIAGVIILRGLSLVVGKPEGNGTGKRVEPSS